MQKKSLLLLLLFDKSGDFACFRVVLKILLEVLFSLKNRTPALR